MDLKKLFVYVPSASEASFITNVINRGGIFYLTPNMNISFVNKMKKYNGMKIEEL